MAAPQKLGHLGFPHAKRSDGAIEVKQVIRGLNKVYETGVTAGTPTKSHSFGVDFGYNAIKGWITNDGDGVKGIGNMTVEYSRDGIIFGEAYTLFPGERIDLDALDLHTLRVTRVDTDVTYRIWQA